MCKLIWKTCILYQETSIRLLWLYVFIVVTNWTRRRTHDGITATKIIYRKIEVFHDQ